MNYLKSLGLIIISLILVNTASAKSITKHEITSVLSEYGLESTGINFSIDEINRQQVGKVSFLPALRSAIESFINDDSSLESPRSLVQEYIYDAYDFEYGTVTEDFIKASKFELVNFMNKSMELRILSLEESPEEGESTSSNWIFYLKISDLSDHLFWAVVDKNGINKTYNYGFN